MTGDFNFNIDHLPESPWFWLLVGVLVVVGLFAMGKPATAFAALSLGVGILCLISNLSSDDANPGLWWVVAVCLVLVIVLGVTAVPSEWSTPATAAALLPTPIGTILEL